MAGKLKAKLGMSPIAWWNDDLPELSDDVSLEECLRQSRSAGFTGMEKGRRFPEDPAVMLPILKAADVTLCGGWFSGTLTIEGLSENKDRIQPMIDLFKAVNAPCIVYGEVGRSIQGDRSKPLATKAVLSGDEMKAYARKMTEFGEWCAARHSLEYDLLLYDVTSTYFEGLAEGNALAQRGYSRDHRPDCKQVCIALVGTREGIPLAHEVFDGNRVDVTTVKV